LKEGRALLPSIGHLSATAANGGPRAGPLLRAVSQPRPSDWAQGRNLPLDQAGSGPTGMAGAGFVPSKTVDRRAATLDRGTVRSGWVRGVAVIRQGSACLESAPTWADLHSYRWNLRTTRARQFPEGGGTTKEMTVDKKEGLRAAGDSFCLERFAEAERGPRGQSCRSSSGKKLILLRAPIRIQGRRARRDRGSLRSQVVRQRIRSISASKLTLTAGTSRPSSTVKESGRAPGWQDPGLGPGR